MVIRRARGWAAVGALAVMLATLSGCGTDTPVTIPTQQPTSEPLFASDEEALAAAEAAYSKYLSISDEIGASGGEDVDRLAAAVTGEQLLREEEAFASYVEKGLKTVGQTQLRAFEIQQSTQSESDIASIGAYACADASGVRVFDKSGKDVTPSDRQNVRAFEINLRSAESMSKQLLIDRVSAWSGDGIC